MYNVHSNFILKNLAKSAHYTQDNMVCYNRISKLLHSWSLHLLTKTVVPKYVFRAKNISRHIKVCQDNLIFPPVRVIKTT